MELLSTIWDYIFSGLLVLVIFGGGIAAAVSARARGWVIGVVVAALAGKAIFSGKESEVPTSHVATPPPATVQSKEPETATATFKNFRHKGDEFTVQCSGDTGNVKCRPLR